MRMTRDTTSACQQSDRLPDFTLTSQDGSRVSLRDFRGKVVAVTFIFASCPELCPMLTAKMADVQEKLGSAFGPKIAFVSITVDPERDTPEVLKEYAQNFNADLNGLGVSYRNSGQHP